MLNGYKEAIVTVVAGLTPFTGVLFFLKLLYLICLLMATPLFMCQVCCTHISLLILRSADQMRLAIPRPDLGVMWLFRYWSETLERALCTSELDL